MSATPVIAHNRCLAGRAQAGASPPDKRLTELIGELSTRSDDFRARWAAHNVSTHRGGSKKLDHREVGELILEVERLSIESTPSLVLSTYTAEPGLTDRRTAPPPRGLDSDHLDRAALNLLGEHRHPGVLRLAGRGLGAIGRFKPSPDGYPARG
jgi:hypothetical protein